jgi:predicted neuraminidase
MIGRVLTATVCLAVIAAQGFSPVAATTGNGREDRFIFPPDRGHVHASSIIETPAGDLLTVWYENGPTRPGFRYPGPDRDKSDDVRIGGAWLPRGASEWTKPFVMADTFGVSDNNPALAIDSRKRLWLIHPTLLGVPGRPWNSAIVQFKVASSYAPPGRPTWETAGILPVHAEGLGDVVRKQIEQLQNGPADRPRAQETARSLTDRLADPLSHRLGWMPRTHPVALDDGRLLLPLANENFYVAAMVFTDLEEWEVAAPVPTVGVLQPAVARLGPSHFVAFFRDGTPTKRVRRSESRDGGRTWTAAEPTTLENPGSGVDVAALPSGALVLVYNDKSSSPRDRLAVSISVDGGRTWPSTRHLENDPGKRFDYPSIIAARDGSIHVTYSSNLTQIKHVRVTEAWVRGK